jgi:hypothetical protein
MPYHWDVRRDAGDGPRIRLHTAKEEILLEAERRGKGE